jgi:ACS family hexuronate transporter-like MFS transporter
MSVSYVDRQALAAVATKVRGELDISHAQYGALGSAFAAAYLVGAPLSGWLLDRLGARRGLVLAVAVWSAVAALHAAAISFATLLLLRVLLGLAEAPSFPGAMQAVRRSLSPARRSAGVGLLFTGSSLGSMVAAPLALYLASRYDWRAAFALIAMAGLAWIPVWLAATTRLRDDRGTRAANERSGASSSADERHLLARGPMWRAMLAVVTRYPLHEPRLHLLKRAAHARAHDSDGDEVGSACAGVAEQRPERRGVRCGPGVRGLDAAVLGEQAEGQ